MRISLDWILRALAFDGLFASLGKLVAIGDVIIIFVPFLAGFLAGFLAALLGLVFLVFLALFALAMLALLMVKYVVAFAASF